MIYFFYFFIYLLYLICFLYAKIPLCFVLFFSNHIYWLCSFFHSSFYFHLFTSSPSFVPRKTFLCVLFNSSFSSSFTCSCVLPSNLIIISQSSIIVLPFLSIFLPYQCSSCPPCHYLHASIHSGRQCCSQCAALVNNSHSCITNTRVVIAVGYTRRHKQPYNYRTQPYVNVSGVRESLTPTNHPTMIIFNHTSLSEEREHLETINYLKINIFSLVSLFPKGQNTLIPKQYSINNAFTLISLQQNSQNSLKPRSYHI